MEIGIAADGIIEPPQTGLNVLIKRVVALLVTCHIGEEFGKEHCYSDLRWHNRYACVGHGNVYITDMLERRTLTVVEDYRQNSEWLEQLFLELAFLRFRNSDNKRDTPHRFGEHVYNE